MWDILLRSGTAVLFTGLYVSGIFIGFFLIPFMVKNAPYNEDEGVELDKKYDMLFLSCKFMEEVEEAPVSTLTEEELIGLKDRTLHYEIPYINQKVIMFYDHERKAFCYYATSSIIYKYINVVARRYVLDFECKQIFKEIQPPMKTEEKTVTFGQFIPKVGKTTMEKEMNLFVYLGSLHDYRTVLVQPNKITFSEYKKQLEAIVGLPSSTLDIQSTKQD